MQVLSPVILLALVKVATQPMDSDRTGSQSQSLVYVGIYAYVSDTLAPAGMVKPICPSDGDPTQKVTWLVIKTDTGFIAFTGLLDASVKVAVTARPSRYKTSHRSWIESSGALLMCTIQVGSLP